MTTGGGSGNPSGGNHILPAGGGAVWAQNGYGQVFYLSPGGGGGGSAGGGRQRAPRRHDVTRLSAMLIGALAGKTIAGARFDGTEHMDGEIIVSFTDGSELRLSGEYDEGVIAEWDKNPA